MIFVTGGTGLVGTHLLFQLTSESENIRALFRTQKRLELAKKVLQYYDPNTFESRWSKIEWVEGDILDIPLLMETMKGCTQVYHCAGLVSHHKKDFNQLIKVNREGTANMVNVALALGVDKFCHVSSTAAVGGNSKKLITERSKWKKTPTTSGYSISKYSAEKEVWRGIEEGLNAVMVNPCVIIGAGNWDDSSLTLFRTLNKGTSYYPPGSNAIVDARDVASIMIKLMNSNISSERFLCIGSNQPIRELMEKVCTQLNVKPPRRSASRFTVSFVRRMLEFGSFLTGRRNALTKETIDNLFAIREYDNQKVRDQLNFQFHTLENAIENAVKGRII